MLTNLEKKLKFVELISEMQVIKRIVYKKDDSFESDADHSWHLAMMVMTFIEDFPDLDYEKCLKFALVHDLVEVFAWDTICFDKIAEKTKTQREKDSLELFRRDFWEILPEIISIMEEYEHKVLKEARFVYSLDKIQPIIQTVLEWWKAWDKFKIDIDDLKQRQYSKIYPEFESLKHILDIYFERAIKEDLVYKKEIWQR